MDDRHIDERAVTNQPLSVAVVVMDVLEYASKPLHRLGVLQRFFCGRIQQVVELLQAVDAQLGYQQQRNTAASTLGGLRVMRLDQSAKNGPRDHPVHLCQEPHKPGLLLLLRLSKAGKSRLLHLRRSFVPSPDGLSPIMAFRSELP